MEKHADRSPLIDFNPHSQALQDDPYPTYGRLRDEVPVLHLPELGFWAVSRYDDVRGALLDPGRFSSMRSLDPNDAYSNVPMIVIMDPPRHGELRSLLSRAFTPRRVSELATRIHQITRGLIDGFFESGRCDLWSDLSAPLPTIVIAELLGIPSEDTEMFKEKSTALASSVGPAMELDPAAIASGRHPVMDLAHYLAQAFEKKRKRPRDDLMSALLAAEIDGQRLAQAELVGFAVLLLIAGNETTTNLISNAAVLLDQYQDQRGLLIEDPSRIDAAIEECLRFDSPVQGLERIVREDLVIGSEKLDRGEKAFLMLGSANRDDCAIPNAGRFDVRRTPNPHLAFGHGTHFCLGASLARLEARIALGALLERAPDYRVSGETKRLYSGAFRGYLSVPIEFSVR